MYFIFFILGAIAHTGYRIFCVDGMRAIFSYLLTLSSILLVLGLGWIIAVAFQDLGTSTSIEAFVVGALILIVAPGAFYLVGRAYDPIDEATILQLTLAYWYGLSEYKPLLPEIFFWSAVLFTPFVLIDSFSKMKHTFFMKTLYTLWYAMLSAGFLVLTLTVELSTIFAAADVLGGLEAFALGIVVVTSIAGLVSSGWLLFSLGIRYESVPEFIPWPAGHLERQLPRTLSLTLIGIWTLIFAVNHVVAILPPDTLLIVSVAAIYEYSALHKIVALETQD